MNAGSSGQYRVPPNELQLNDPNYMAGYTNVPPEDFDWGQMWTSAFVSFIFFSVAYAKIRAPYRTYTD